MICVKQWKEVHIKEADERYVKCKRDRILVLPLTNWSEEEHEEISLSKFLS